MSPNALVVYKSSAGSGKTYTLVMEYLKLVLKKPSLYRHILAITFTNKATEEMKSRIVDALVEISTFGLTSDQSAETMKFVQAVSEQSGIPLPELPVRAQKVLDYILHDYSRFSVSTIDSFFSRMVRSLSRELHLPLKFDLELDTDYVIREITTAMLSDLSENEVLLNWLTEYVFDKLDSDKGWILEYEIHQVARHLFDEQYRQLFPGSSHPPDPEFVKSLKQIKSGFEDRMASIGNRFELILDDHALTVDDFAYKKTGVAGFLSKIKNKLNPDAYVPGKRFLAALEGPEKWVTKGSPHAQQIITLAQSDLISLGQEVVDLVEKQYKIYVSAVCVLSTAYMAGILGTLDEELTEFRKENETLLISDNNVLLAKAISGQDAPFIYEKSGNRFSHFMLDEFQDTSSFQWNNLLPLIENSLGSGHFTMIVGDAKQSIYRWRGGNMNLLQHEINHHLKAFSSITEQKKLDANYRSREVIVNFNNRFFELAPHTFGLPPETSPGSSSYAPDSLHQEWKKGVTGDGYVQFKFFEKQEEQIDTETGEIMEETVSRESACAETLITIKKLYDNGFQPRDIAILTRKNKDAKEITSYLLDHGISQIISPESMQLNRSAKVLLLISALQFIEDQQDDIALSYLVYYRLFLQSDQEKNLAHEAISANRTEKLKYLPEAFREKLSAYRRIPLYELSEELTGIFELNAHPDAYIQRFLDVIIEFTGKYPGSIREFLEWWDENQDKENCSVIIPSGENAIRVMTIHKSKGLQFPVVIMPFADYKLSPHPSSVIWVDSDMEPFNQRSAHPVKISKSLQTSLFADDYNNEITQNYIDNLNLFYVACTRAEEQLYVFSKKISSDPKDTLASDMSRFIIETLLSEVSWSEQFSSGSGDMFELGQFSKPLRAEKNKKTDAAILNRWISNSWHDRIGVAINKKKIFSGDPDVADTSYGLLYHDIVSTVLQSAEPLNIINSYFRDQKPDHDTMQKLTQDLETFMKYGEHYGWFHPGKETLTEIELLMPDGSILRPDRLVIEGASVTVVDYKTGGLDEKHEEQVKRYAGALQEMGFDKISMFLVYPALRKLIEVKAA